MAKVGEGQARGQWQPLSQPEAETCPELSRRPAVLGFSAEAHTHKGNGGENAGGRAQDRSPATGSWSARTSASAWDPVPASPLQDTHHSVFSPHTPGVCTWTNKRPILSTEQLMCCGVLRCNRRVDQAHHLKIPYFIYIYLLRKT